MIVGDILEKRKYAWILYGIIVFMCIILFIDNGEYTLSSFL